MVCTFHDSLPKGFKGGGILCLVRVSLQNQSPNKVWITFEGPRRFDRPVIGLHLPQHFAQQRQIGRVQWISMLPNLCRDLWANVVGQRTESQNDGSTVLTLHQS